MTKRQAGNSEARAKKGTNKATISVNRPKEPHNCKRVSEKKGTRVCGLEITGKRKELCIG